MPSQDYFGSEGIPARVQRTYIHPPLYYTLSYLPGECTSLYYRRPVDSRDDAEHGCPSAALLDEIGRCSEATRHAYTDEVLAVVLQIAAVLAPADPQSARGQTLSLFALLIGTLQLSRALADRRLADEALERGIENALALLPGA